MGTAFSMLGGPGDLLGRPIIENGVGQHDTEKLLLKTQVSEDFA